MASLERVWGFDLVGRARRHYAGLGPDRGVFLAAFGLGVLTYFFFISQTLLNNHASRFPWLLPGGIGSGRWLSPWIGYLHYGADVPVLLPVAGVLIAVCSGMLARRVWGIPLGPFPAFLVVAAVVTYPATLALLYYSFMSPLLFGSILFGLIALTICDRFEPKRIAVSALFVLMLLATYQPAVGVLVTVAVTAAIGRIMRAPGVSAIRSALLTGVARAAALLAGGVVYRLSLAVMGEVPPRSITYTSLYDIPARVWEVIFLAFDHLRVTQPELLAPVKMTLLVILVAAVVVSLMRVRRSVPAIVAVLALWILAVISTKILFLVVAPDGSYWEYRYNMALGYLHAFSLAVVLTAFTRKILVSGIQLLAIFVVASFVQANLVRQGVLWRGQQHDLAIANRILDRIEQLPDIDYSRTYDLIRVGRYSSYRYNLLRSQGHEYYRLGDTHMDMGEISDRWVDEDVFRLLGSSINFRHTSTDPSFTANIRRVQAELLEGRRPWPAPESVFINGDEIIVYMRAE